MKSPGQKHAYVASRLRDAETICGFPPSDIVRAVRGARNFLFSCCFPTAAGLLLLNLHWLFFATMPKTSKSSVQPVPEKRGYEFGGPYVWSSHCAEES